MVMVQIDIDSDAIEQGLLAYGKNAKEGIKIILENINEEEVIRCLERGTGLHLKGQEE